MLKWSVFFALFTFLAPPHPQSSRFYESYHRIFDTVRFHSNAICICVRTPIDEKYRRKFHGNLSVRVLENVVLKVFAVCGFG